MKLENILGQDVPSEETAKIEMATNNFIYNTSSAAIHPEKLNEELENNIQAYKKTIQDFENEIDNLSRIIENSPTIAQIAENASHFIDSSDKSKEDLGKVITELRMETRVLERITKNTQERLERLNELIPSNPKLN